MSGSCFADGPMGVADVPAYYTLTRFDREVIEGLLAGATFPSAPSVRNLLAAHDDLLEQRAIDLLDAREPGLIGGRVWDESADWEAIAEGAIFLLLAPLFRGFHETQGDAIYWLLTIAGWVLLAIGTFALLPSFALRALRWWRR